MNLHRRCANLFARKQTSPARRSSYYMTWSRQSSGIYIHDCLRIESASMMDVGSMSVCACCPQRNFLTRQVLISGSFKPFPGRSLLLLSTTRLLPSRFNYEPPESTLCPTCSSVRRMLHFLSTERRLTRTDTTRGSQPIICSITRPHRRLRTALRPNVINSETFRCLHPSPPCQALRTGSASAQHCIPTQTGRRGFLISSSFRLYD